MASRLLAIALSVLVACTGFAYAQSPRDSTGTIMELGKWHHAPLTSFPVNIIDAPDMGVSKILRRIRDNGALEQWNLIFSAPWSGARIEWIPIDGFYNLNVTSHMRSQSQARSDLYKTAKAGTDVDWREIYRFQDRGGWIVTAEHKKSGRSCISAQMGLATRDTGYGSDDRYNLILYMRDCSGKHSIDKWESWLKQAKEVPEGYNR